MTELRLPRPEEGWMTLVLVGFLALLLALAIDDPGWVSGKAAATDGLPLLAMFGIAVGFAGPKLGWGRWTTHLVGAAFAGLLIPVFAGWALYPGAPVAEAFTATAAGSVNAYLDIAWRGRQFTSEEIHYVLVLGILVWATAQFAAYAVFGHHRPFNAVVVTGLVLVGNMSITSRDQLPYLVAFTGAALFLLIGMHAFDERTAWLRRRIGDPGALAGLYLRGGSVFIAVALLGSLVLTWRAASSPLAGAWSGVNDQLVDFGEAVSRLFPVGGDVRGTGSVRFGSTARIASQWFSDGNVAFTATVPGVEPPFVWRAATYDTFALTGWEQTDVTPIRVPAGELLLVGTPENPVTEDTRPLSVTVTPDGYQDVMLLSPGTPMSVNKESTVLFGGTDGWFDGVEVPSRSTYTVSAALLNLGDTEVISGNRLRVAGTDYPADVRARYTEVPVGAIGPDAADLLATIRATAASDNPYDLAVAMQAYLSNNSNFRYTVDVRNVPCSSDSAVECFARTKQGYCLHYASTMAILLRAANPANPIPTRLVQGFLPGERSGNTETVLNRSAHAWVEVYFPGYGWIPFDPTGGGVGRPTEIPAGPVVASPRPTPAATDNGGVEPTRRVFRDPDAGGSTGPGPTSQPEDRSLFIVLTVLLAALVGGVALAAWFRGPRGELNPDSAWHALSRGASRLGFAPRPTQTIYEYASSLGDLVPVARPDLHTVAQAKVETSYARARLGGDRLRAVSQAMARLRFSLLRLLLRRGARRLGRRG